MNRGRFDIRLTITESEDARLCSTSVRIIARFWATSDVVYTVIAETADRSE